MKKKYQMPNVQIILPKIYWQVLTKRVLFTLDKVKVKLQTGTVISP